MATTRTKPRAWTADEVAYVRANVGTASHAAIAAELGRSRKSVQSWCKKFKVATRKFWTTEEIEFVRVHTKKLRTVEIAKRLGRSLSSTYQIQRKLGLSDHYSTPEERRQLKTLIRRRHAEQWSDAEIAVEASCSREWISETRRALGLPDNNLSERRRRKVAEKTRRQLERAGLKSIGLLRVEAFKQRARDAGWPEDLELRSVMILNELWRQGPITRRELCAAIGVPWKGSRASMHSNRPAGSFLADLMQRGMVICLGRKVKIGKRKGQTVNLYMLSPTIERKKVAYGNPNHVPEWERQWKNRHGYRHEWCLRGYKKHRAASGLDGQGPAGGGRSDCAGGPADDLRQAGRTGEDRGPQGGDVGHEAGGDVLPGQRPEHHPEQLPLSRRPASGRADAGTGGDSQPAGNDAAAGGCGTAANPRGRRAGDRSDVNEIESTATGVYPVR